MTILPAIVNVRHVEELELRRRGADRLLEHLHRVRALQLEAEGPARRPSVRSAVRSSTLDGHVVAAGLGVEHDPVQRRRTADEVESFSSEENRITSPIT